MVLPVRNNRVKNTAPRIARRTKPTSPNCLMKAIAKSFAGCVFVSFGEFANSASIRAETAADCAGSSMRSSYHPTWPLPKLRPSSNSS